MVNRKIRRLRLQKELPTFYTCHHCRQIRFARFGANACDIQAIMSEEIGHIIDWSIRGHR